MKVTRILLAVSLSVMSASAVSGMRSRAVDAIDHRIVATMRTGTMEKELNQGAAAGYRFQAVMGGETALGGKEVVAVMSRPTGGGGSRYEYKLLATNMDVLGGKTGFIHKAGYCLATLLQIPQGSQVAVVVLGAANSATRFWEARHLFDWVVGKGSGIIGDDDARVAPAVIIK